MAKQRKDHDIYMSAAEAAAALEINVATLYSYVSRKNIRTHKPVGSRASRYLREDIEQLKSGMPLRSERSATPGLTNSSTLTLMAEKGSYYRGVSAVELSRRASLEDTARLLWATGEQDPFTDSEPTIPTGWDALFAATQKADLGPLDRFAVLLPVLESADLGAYDLNKPSFTMSAAVILRWMAAILLSQKRPGQIPIHAYIASVTKCGPALEQIVRQLLVLSADQAMEPTTYAVRAVANAGATSYRCVLAGLCAAAGKRLPSVRTASFLRFVREIASGADPTEPVRMRLRESEALPGFGYSPFPSKSPDPRSKAIWAAMKKHMAGDAKFLRLERAATAAMELTGNHPDFAFLAVWIGTRLDGTRLIDLVRLGRTVGWLAHAMEQQEKPLIRWKINYSGPLP